MIVDLPFFTLNWLPREPTTDGAEMGVGVGGVSDDGPLSGNPEALSGNPDWPRADCKTAESSQRLSGIAGDMEPGRITEPTKSDSSELIGLERACPHGFADDASSAPTPLNLRPKDEEGGEEEEKEKRDDVMPEKLKSMYFLVFRAEVLTCC